MGARRVVHHDRRARASAVVEWRSEGALARAAVRIPDGSWVSIEPRAGVEAPWGEVDRLWHAAEPLVIGGAATPLSVVAAVDWARVATIPPLAEPARLPPGAGTAVLNLLATLAREQGARRLAYGGPYPTEALFLALLECFRPDPADDDLLARFMGGGLAWTPAPFVADFAEAAYVQWRERIEKVVWRGRAYYREDWGTVRRRAPLRVRDGADGVRCSLWALGAPIEDHVIVGADGVPRVVASPAPAAPAQPMPAALRDGLVATVVAMSAAPLAAALREVAAASAFTWAPVAFDLARVDAREVRVSSRLRIVIRRRLAEAADDETRALVALAALAEMATAVGDALRARAQARLAAASPAAQADAFRDRADDPAAARAITAAVAHLVASGGAGDQPDVEGDEGGDRDD